MKWAFLVSGLVEIIGAIICYLQPEFIFQNSVEKFSSLYGISALVIGIINVLLFAYYEENKLTKAILLTMMFFHGAVAMSIYGSMTTSFIRYPIPAIATHLILFTMFLVGYMRDIKPTN